MVKSFGFFAINATIHSQTSHVTLKYHLVLYSCTQQHHSTCWTSPNSYNNEKIIMTPHWICIFSTLKHKSSEWVFPMQGAKNTKIWEQMQGEKVTWKINSSKVAKCLHFINSHLQYSRIIGKEGWSPLNLMCIDVHQLLVCKSHNEIQKNQHVLILAHLAQCANPLHQFDPPVATLLPLPIDLTSVLIG